MKDDLLVSIPRPPSITLTQEQCDQLLNNSKSDIVVISRSTAEYFAVLAGQVVWGNQNRRAKACHELGEAMGKVPMSSSIDCFDGGKS